MENIYISNSVEALDSQSVVRFRIIEQISLEDNILKLRFEDGSYIEIYDNGQDCCEKRYMSCDDEFGDYVGSALLNIELRDAQYADEDSYEVHEISFLVVRTSSGVVNFANHNEHNGYYGGFSICATFYEK